MLAHPASFMSEQPSSDHGSSRNLTVRATLRTDVGLVRSENQDFGACTTIVEEQQSPSKARLLIVADGMGGHRGGATASRLAAETLKHHFLTIDGADIVAALRDSLVAANARIYSEAQANPDLRGMGTTTSVLAVRGGEGWLAHVGDSRIYRVRGDSIEQLTEDHSLVATMVREGLLTSEEAENHPRRNVLQRSMGVAAEVDVDVRGPLQLQEGDTFILCSDGLHGVVKELELKEIAHEAIETAADEYVRRALERGAPDNVTVIVARVEPAEDPLDQTIGDPEEKTQPVLPPEPSPFDETVKDVALPAQNEIPAAAALGDPVLHPTTPEPTTPEPAPSESATGDEVDTEPFPRRGGSIVRWILLVALLLGAAGAWLYWSHYEGFGSSQTTTQAR